MRILIAGGRVGIAKALKLVLEKNRFAVDMVHNGLDALEYMLSVSYDAVVLDIMMPGLDGLEVLKRAREKAWERRCCFSRPRPRSRIALPDLTRARTTICPSPLPWVSLSRACARSRAAAEITRPTLYASAARALILAPTRFRPAAAACALIIRSSSSWSFSCEIAAAFFDGCSHAEGLGSRHGVGNGRRVDIHRLLRKKLRQLDADVEIKTIRGAGYALEAK